VTIRKIIIAGFLGVVLLLQPAVFGFAQEPPIGNAELRDTSGEVGEWEGTLKAMHGTDMTYYFLATLEKTYNLIYESEIPANFIRQTIRVTGVLAGRTIYATSLVLVGPGAPQFMHITTGVATTSVIALRYSDIVNQPMTTAALGNLIFGPLPSLKTLWEENSYNNLIVQNSGVYGWLALPNSEAFYNPAGANPLWTQLVEDALTIANANGIQFQNYNRLILFFNGTVGGAYGYGLDYVTYQAPYGPVILSISWIAASPNGFNIGVNGQEYGHQIGFDHSGNVYSIYDSPWDVMSNALFAPCVDQGQHTIVSNKIDGNWFTGGATTTSNTSFLEAVIYPTTRTSGLRAIKITTSNPDVYFTVEVRRQENHDSCLPNQGVIIHKVDNLLSDWQAKPIDATPGDGTLNNAQWNVGQMYFDEDYNFRVHIVSNQPNDGKLVRIEPFQMNWTADQRITFSPGTSYAPTLSKDMNGNLHIAWEDDRNGNWEIYYKKLNNNGINLTPDIRLTVDSAQSRKPSLETDSNGNVHIAWYDDRDGNFEIYYIKLNNNGAPLTLNTRVTFDPELSLQPWLDVDINGNVHIAWNDNRDGNWEIYYKKLNNIGASLTPDIRVTNDSGLSGDTKISLDPSGNVHVAWHDDRHGDTEIYYRKLSNNGIFLTPEIRVTSASLPSDNPSISTDSNGNVHIAWLDRRDGGNYELYYKKLDNNGVGLTPDIRLTNDSAITQHNNIDTDLDDNIHIAWFDHAPGNFEIYYQKLNNNGGSLTPNIRLTFNSAISANPDITTDSNGNVHIVWPDDRPGNTEIYYKRSLPQAGISVQGIPSIGSQISIDLADPVNYNSQYFLLMSLGTSPGIPLPGGGFLSLNFDGAFLLSLFYPNLINLNNSQGTFNFGQATATWDIPNIPSIVGTKVYLAFVAINPSGQILSVSNVLPLTLLGEYTSDANTGALWHFDEGVGITAFDSSPNNNHGTLINGTIWTPATQLSGSSYAAQFDGINDYIVVPDSSSLEPQNQITIEFWIKIYVLNTRHIIDKTPATPNQGYLVSIGSGGQVQFTLNNAGNAVLISNNQLSSGQWHHIAAVYNGNTMKIFIDGVQDPATLSYSAQINPNTSSLYIGRDHPGQGNNNYFNGLLDELRISNIARY